MSSTLRSPFFSRNYGGYSADQIAFVGSNADIRNSRVLLDPMAGQGFYISQVCSRKTRVYLGDINLGPLMLASLRDPALIARSGEILSHFTEKISSHRRPEAAFEPRYCEDWISPRIRQQLDDYSRVFDLSRHGDPTKPSSEFWRSPLLVRFAAAVPVLAARTIACFTESDNVTWLKRGGLERCRNLFETLGSAAAEWHNYAVQAGAGAGHLHISTMNARAGEFGSCPSSDLIVTSPPYANRLDYSRMWAPELQVCASLFQFDPASVKSGQIGTTVVSDGNQDDLAFERVPRFIRRTLDRIRRDESAKASESYYYPFFRNYATSTCECFRHLAEKTAQGGRLIVFIRDTTRKDILFEAGKMVETVLREHGLSRLAKREAVIRHHVGMLRRGSPATVYGLAQREWSMAFQKRDGGNQ